MLTPKLTLDIHFKFKTSAYSLSIGVATYQPGDDINETINNADKALYQAKSHGRNQVCMAPTMEKKIKHAKERE